MAVEDLSPPHDSSGIVTVNSCFEQRVTGKIIDYQYSYHESSPPDQLPPDQLRPIASQTIDSALQVGFLQRLNGRLVAENGELMTTKLQFTLPDETIILTTSGTVQGREINISGRDSNVSLSDKSIPIVDVKKNNSEVIQSTKDAPSEAIAYIQELDEKIGDIEPETPLLPRVESKINRFDKI